MNKDIIDMNDTFPTISIVIPSFNQGHFLEDAIRSILRQEYPKIEVVVMDGGSTDNSLSIIESYAKYFKYWRSRPDEGQSSAINEGISYCDGDLVTWLNADDFYYENSLWIVAQAFASHPKCGLYMGNGFRYDQEKAVLKPFCPRHVVFDREALAEGLDYVLQPSTFVLKDAWEDEGGLRTELEYGMDWYLYQRISDRYPVVTINEFLSVSREYSQTKTATGAIGRAIELMKIAQERTSKQLTLGSAYYLFETLLSLTENVGLPELKSPIYAAMKLMHAEMQTQWGARDPFPVYGDPQDKVFIPIPFKKDEAKRFGPRILKEEEYPSISVIIPSYNQAEFLTRCLDSIINQAYPNVEIIVFDGGSTDGSVEILGEYTEKLTFWKSEPDRGPSHAINKGLALATGEIIGWLNSDDMLAEGALWRIAEAFIEDPTTDVVFGNALYIDEVDRLRIVDHGYQLTALYYGQQQPYHKIPQFWTYIHAVPQPTVYFRKEMLDEFGNLNESYHCIFDFELFWRFSKSIKFKKVERTLAFYRIHGRSKTSGWENFLIELYRFSRPIWPSIYKRDFYNIAILSYLKTYLRRRFGAKRGIRFWLEACLVGLSVLLRIGNPEVRLARHQAKIRPIISNIPSSIRSIEEDITYEISKLDRRFSTIFCSFTWPMHPGHSGGEIRDFHILRKLLSISETNFISVANHQEKGRRDYLKPYLKGYSDPKTLMTSRRDLVHQSVLSLPPKSKLLAWMRRHDLPVLGARYHADIARFSPQVNAFALPIIREILEEELTDFLIVSPQLNPLVLNLNNIDALPSDTRLILASYDVESERISNLAQSMRGLSRVAWELETKRAEAFARDNLKYFDGVVAVSELDKLVYVEKYGIEPERVLVIENGVDTSYFAFRSRVDIDTPNVVFIGSLVYQPNDQAAQRLLKSIMPIVRKTLPDVKAYIVGAAPPSELFAFVDDDRNIVTGRVPDVRPFLNEASVVCIPLLAGSGTKYKVLEAMSVGTPIVCTSLAIKGFDDKLEQYVRLGESDREIADALIDILKYSEAYYENVLHARDHVERLYSWDRNLNKLPDWLDRIIALPKRYIG